MRNAEIPQRVSAKKYKKMDQKKKLIPQNNLLKRGNSAF